LRARARVCVFVCAIPYVRVNYFCDARLYVTYVMGIWVGIYAGIYAVIANLSLSHTRISWSFYWTSRSYGSTKVEHISLSL